MDGVSIIVPQLFYLIVGAVDVFCFMCDLFCVCCVFHVRVVLSVCFCVRDLCCGYVC